MTKKRKAREFQIIVNECGALIDLREVLDGIPARIRFDLTYGRKKCILVREVLPRGKKASKK
jgi:hypothetical protein